MRSNRINAVRKKAGFIKNLSVRIREKIMVEQSDEDSMVSQKRIPYVKIGHSIRFDLQKIDEFIRKHSFEVNKVWE